MSRTRIKNTSNGTLVLPSPLHGILHPSRSVVSSKSVAQLEALFNITVDNGKLGIRLTDEDVANPDVTTGLEGDTIGETAASTEYTPTVSADYPGTDPDDVADALDRLAARTVTMQVRREKIAADSAAADATAAFTIGRLPIAGIVTAARFIPDGVLTAHDTHYGTLVVTKGDGTGGVATAVASQTTKITGGSGDWLANKPVSLGAISNATSAAGTVIGGAITKQGDGVAVPAGIWEVDYTPASGA